MSATRDIAARVAACKAKAQALMAELDGLVSDLPEWRDGAEGMEGALMAVREELQAAAGQVDGVLDYLTPRSDSDDPGCCAHRRLQALMATEEARR